MIGQLGLCSDGPSLPFDFTVSDFACFLLSHSAVFITEVWGEIDVGPIGLLEADEYGDAGDAAIVLKHAYRLLQDAIAKTEPPPNKEMESAAQAREVLDEVIELSKMLELGISKQEEQTRHAIATT